MIFRWLMAQALQEAQVDQQIDQRILVGDRRAMAQVGSLDPEGDRLRVDAFDGGAFPIQLLVTLALAVESVPEARPDAGGHHHGAAAFLPAGMMDRTGLPNR